MGLVYTVELLNEPVVSAARDLFEITAPSDAVVRIVACRFGQNLDEGGSQAEMLAIAIARYTGADGTGGSTPTPRPREVGYPVAGSSVRANTTEGATKTRVVSDAFNVQAGWLYMPPPKEVIVLSPSGKLTIYFPGVSADSLNVDMTFTFEEIGGSTP